MKITLIVLIIILNLNINVQATSYATKKEATYEITNIKIINNKLIIEGWGFITDTQHYLNDSDHDYELLFKSNKGDSFVVTKELINKTTVNLSNMMSYDGIRWCGNNEYDKTAPICNYYYNKVGFSAEIPLESFKDWHKYEVALKLYANNSGKIKQIRIFYPFKNDILLTNDQQKIYRVSSKLDATNLTVNTEYVRANLEPWKGSDVLKSNLTCNNNDKVYHSVAETYTNVVDRKINNGVTWYRLTADLAGCYLDRRRLKDGHENLVWIMSQFIEYSGEPLTITVEREIIKIPYIRFINLKALRDFTSELYDNNDINELELNLTTDNVIDYLVY
ncbi:MAG: hypothetical protein ACK5G7_06625 [Erysipelotrichaceae bacterium]